MPCQIANVPQRIGLALEQRDDDAPARSKRGLRRPEEIHKQLLVVSDLPINVRRLATNMGKVENNAFYRTGRGIVIIVGVWPFRLLPQSRRRSEEGELTGVDTVHHAALWGRLDGGNVLGDVGVLGRKFGKVFLEYGRCHMSALMMGDERGSEGEIAFANKKDGVGGMERECWYLMLLLGLLGRGIVFAMSSLLLLGRRGSGERLILLILVLMLAPNLILLGLIGLVLLLNSLDGVFEQTTRFSHSVNCECLRDDVG